MSALKRASGRAGGACRAMAAAESATASKVSSVGLGMAERVHQHALPRILPGKGGRSPVHPAVLPLADRQLFQPRPTAPLGGDLCAFWPLPLLSTVAHRSAGRPGPAPPLPATL